jgi:PAP2 superfamily C-terminal
MTQETRYSAIPLPPVAPTPPARAPWWVRGPFVVVALIGWFSTQAMLGSRTFPAGVVIGDGLLDLLAGPNRYMNENPWAADILLISSSTIINVLGVFLLAVSVFGKTVRPFLGLLMVFAMRQLCQSVCALPAPEGIVWHYPGVPGLLVTYEVSNDFFFSGHTGLAVLGAVELVRFGGRRLLPLGIFIVFFEVTAVLVLRAHYTMDVFTGGIAALYATVLAERWAPWCDDTLARVSGR